MKLENPPIAFLITFTCYGTWLHGREEGSVDKRRHIPGTDVWQREPRWSAYERDLIGGGAYRLDDDRRKVVLEAVQVVCARRGWRLLAVHVRPTHVHVVVSGVDDPETMARSMKAFATHALNEAYPDETDRRRWTRHASTRYLWRQEAVAAAVHYVVYEQGDPLALIVAD